MYNSKIKFVLPDSDKLRNLNFYILDLFNKRRYLFNDNIELSVVYGQLVKCLFNGGRIYSDSNKPLEMIKTILKAYKSYNSEYRFTLTNNDISSEYLNDYYSNLLLKLCEETHSGVILNNDLIYNYIKEKYNINNIVLSTTLCSNLEETIDNLKSNKYNIVVLSTKLNNKLEEIPKEYRSKCEILVNDCCNPNCPNRKSCYLNTVKFDMCKVEEKDIGCKNINKQTIIENNTDNTYDYLQSVYEYTEALTFKDIEKAHNLGYDYFKLEGRSSSVFKNIYNYAKYLVKEEYKSEFLFMVLEQVLNGEL